MTNLNALSGIELDQFMDRLDTQYQDCDSCSLLTSLRAQPLKADSLDAIERLHVLWVNAGDSNAAKAVLEHDAAALLSSVPDSQQPELTMNLIMLRLRLANYLNDDSALLEQLETLAAMAERSLNFDVEHYRHHHMFEALECGSLEVALKAIEVRYSLATSNPDRATVQAWDMADRLQRRARVLASFNDDEPAREAALEAVAALRTAGPEQSVDATDWLWLGNALISIIPLRLAMFEQPISRLIAHLPAPQQREWEVRMARLAARSKYAQGELDQALRLCATASLSLDSDASNNFIECHLPWLVESGQIDAAGYRAFIDVYDQRTEVWPGTVRLVHDRLQDPDDQRVWWPLCVMRACDTPETLQAFSAALPSVEHCTVEPSTLLALLYRAAREPDLLSDVFAHARAEAQRRAPDHHWIKRLASVHDYAAGVIEASTQVRLLQEAVRDGSLQDNRTAFSLFSAHVQVEGVIAALRQPTPVLASGWHAYNYALTIDRLVEEKAETLTSTERQEASDLLASAQINAYEQGRTRMEQYFACGTGHPYDACAHLYSMLCNNLAILYRCTRNPATHDLCLDLHRRGIQASPFAEHYQGVLNVYRAQDDYLALIDAAEQLWHYAQDYGYSRHDLNDYICDVAYALLMLNRSGEILIWVERLLKCQQEQGISDQQLSVSQLHTRVALARFLAQTYPDNAYGLWLRYARCVEAANMITLMLEVAKMFEYLGRNAEAIEYYLRIQVTPPTEADWVDPDWPAIENTLASLQRAEKASHKRWWQVWK